jgi:hypothetical protein
LFIGRHRVISAARRCSYSYDVSGVDQWEEEERTWILRINYRESVVIIRSCISKEGTLWRRTSNILYVLARYDTMSVCKLKSVSKDGGQVDVESGLTNGWV